MAKSKSIAIVLTTFLIFLLLGQMSFRVYAEIIPVAEVKTEVFFNYHWSENVNGRLLQIRTNYVMERIDTVTLTGIPKLTQLRAYGWVEVNGDRIRFLFNTTKYPTDKIYSIFKVKSTSTRTFSGSASPVYEIWDGITFITTASSPLHIKYNHPDNGPYYPSTYDIPPNEASPTTLKGNEKYHRHIPVWIIDDMKKRGNLMSLVGAIASLIAILLSIPEGFTKILAVVLGVIGGVLAVLGIAIVIFAEEVLETEMSDGWTWIWGEGKWWRFLWWWQSFGRWRDWGWFFFTTTARGGGGRNALLMMT